VLKSVSLITSIVVLNRGLSNIANIALLASDSINNNIFGFVGFC
jgi:hypothetical protein